jgi:hypothetical protein
MTNKFIEVVKRWRAGGEEVSVEALQANANAANASAAYAAAYAAAAEAAYAALYAADATYAADYWVKRYEELTNMSRKKIQNVDCYGEVKPDTSFIICCDNEDYDGVYADGNPNDEDYEFSNWDEVVTYLLKYYRSDIIQIETDSIKELLSNEQKNC